MSEASDNRELNMQINAMNTVLFTVSAFQKSASFLRRIRNERGELKKIAY